MSKFFALGGQSIGVSALMISVESIIMPKQQALIRTGSGQIGISPPITTVLSTSYPFSHGITLFYFIICLSPVGILRLSSGASGPLNECKNK